MSKETSQETSELTVGTERGASGYRPLRHRKDLSDGTEQWVYVMNMSEYMAAEEGGCK